MKEPKFLSKAHKAPAQVLEFSDIGRIKQYQLELINTVAYEQPRYKDGSGGVDHFSLDKIHKEIHACEVWLKEQNRIAVNDKNRRIAC